MNNIHSSRIYSVCRGNATAAQKMYPVRYHERRRPSVRIFIRVHTRLSETGRVVPRYVGSGRISARNIEPHSQISRAIENKSRASVRRINC